MKPLHILALSTLLIFTLSACGGAAPEEIPNPGPNSNTPAAANTRPASTPEISLIEPPPVDDTNTIPRDLAEKAKDDLAGYLNINADQIHVVEARTVDWPDAALGCPQPDMMYAQVATPGYWLILEANGRQYPYHTDMEGQVILCLGSSPGSAADMPPLPIIPVDPTEIMDGQPWVPVN